MDSGRLKTIAILILVCVNLAFGGLLLSERVDSAEGEAQTRSDLVRVMEGLGIQLTEEQIPANETHLRRSAHRDRGQELAFARALLGEVEAQEQGGNIWYCENENGWAWFRSGGSFELMLKSGGASLEERMVEGGLRARRDGESYICLAGDTEVFNCTFSLSQRSGGVYISGRLLLGEPAAGEEIDCPDAATLLLRFYDRIRDAGGVFSRIEEIRSGYVLSASASGSELLPVWQMRTDGGTWYLDLQTDRLVAVSG